MNVTIRAEQVSEGKTKTSREPDKNVYWLPNEEINVICGNDMSKFTSTNTQKERIAAFTGQLLISTVIGATEGNENNAFIWGLYPYDANAISDGTYVTTTLPHAQTGISGTFADKLFLTLAKSQSFNLGFYSVCSGFRFSLTKNNITSISFAGNNNEDIAGKVKLTFVDGVPHAEVLEGQKTITLTPENTTFETGVDYYFVFLPTVFSQGFTVSFTTNDGVGEFVFSNPVTFQRNIFVNKSQVDKDVVIGVANLSEDGPANSYIVSQKGVYKFEATKGNSYESVGSIQGVKVLWESFGTTIAPVVGDLIKSDVSYADGYITFATNDVFKEGNAVIAAYSDAACTDGNVLWSWHIWMTDNPIEQVYANNVGTMMDRNLGATCATPGEVGSLGLMYQWGRKDPFLGSGTHPASSTVAASTIVWPTYVSSDATHGTIDYATKNPTTYIYKNSNNKDWVYTGPSYRWSGSNNSKTIYDPCPTGWHVPDASFWLNAGFPDMEHYSYDSTHYGVSFPASLCGSEAWYPSTGAYYMSTSINNVSDGYMWASSLNTPYADSYYFHNWGTGEVTAARGVFELYNMMPVRCCKDYGSVISVTSLALDKKVTSVSVGNTVSLTPTIKPDSQASKTITWTSSNNSVATVSTEGVISGISEGQAKITASVDGKTATCSVLVGDYPEGNISFSDNNCKSVCVHNWDIDGDGELSYVEAGFVTKLESEFSNSSIVSFNELQYFVNCTRLDSHRYKSGGDYYADGTFESQRNLTSITLPPGLTSLGENCFSCCISLTSIEIPATVSSIGFSCFSSCNSLNRVSVKATTPPTLSFYDTYYETYQSDPETFKNVPGKIYVPSSVVSTYKTANGWSLYSSKIYGE